MQSTFPLAGEAHQAMTDRALTEAERRRLRDIEAFLYLPTPAAMQDFMQMTMRLLAEHAALLAVARAAKKLRDMPEFQGVCDEECALMGALSATLVQDMLNTP